MSRVIDADENMEWAEGNLPSKDKIIITEFLRDCSTIDPVHAARGAYCRECKYYCEFRTKRRKQLMRLCCRMGKNDMEYPVKPDDFCSYGKPKEVQGDE